MPRRAKAKGLYSRGPYWLDWDRRRDGSLRSPFLAIFWYDPERGRTRSTSTGEGDVAQAKAALDRHYLQTTEGAAICPTCGQRRVAGSGFLVLQAIQDYLASKHGADPAIGHRLAHITNYIASTGAVSVTCESIKAPWIERFRQWAAEQPIVSPNGKSRARSLSTIENSVLQLAAAINAAHARGDTSRPAQFKPIPTKELNRTPQHRSDIAELARMFAYAIDPRFPVKRGPLHRFLIASVATLGRPDAVHDISTDPKRRQWNSNARILDLNPEGRRQTKKYRPTVPVAWQAALHLDGRIGYFVGVKSVKSAWESMEIDLKLPRDGQSGMKLIRRSMAKLLRDRLPKADWTEVELFLGHDKFDNTSDIYAPFDPNYLAAARKEIEAIISEIEKACPGAFHRTNTGEGATVIPMRGAKNG